MVVFKSLSSCPSCSSSHINLIADYGDSPLCDNYLSTYAHQEYYPLRLYHCRNCSLAFIDTIVPPVDIYNNYIYLTQSSPGLSSHFASYAHDVIAKFKLADSPTYHFVDIGGNDGSLLRHFKYLLPSSHITNIEPSGPATQRSLSQGINTYRGYFDSDAVKYLSTMPPLSFVFMNNMFANIPDLHDFLDNLSLVFSRETVGCIESSYLLDMVHSNVVDFVYHEHLYYFSLSSISFILNSHGFELFDFQHVSTKGGSIRYYFAKPGNFTISKILNTQIESEKLFFDSDFYFKWFPTTSSSLKDLCTNDLLLDISSFCVYGASATTTTLLSLLPESWHIDYMIDDNPSKHNTFSPISPSIKVFDFEFLFSSRHPVVIISAWRFFESILHRLNTIPDYNPIVIIPLPKPRVSRLHDLL